MKRIFTILLAVIVIFPITAHAAEGHSETPVVSLINDTNVPYQSYVYWQGDVMSFQLHFPARHNDSEAVGLVAAGTSVDALYDSKGNINKDLFLYEAKNSYNFISLDTSTVKPGNYRFVYVCPWKDTYSDVKVTRAAYAYYDVTIRAKEVASAWAKDEIEKAISCRLVPKVLSNRYTSAITRDHFMLIINSLISAKTAKSSGGAVGLVDFAARKNLTVSDNPFTDINHRYFADTSHNYIVAAYKLGIVNGKSNTTFDPNGLLTRQEAATILWRTAKALGIDSSGTAANFKDNSNIAAWAVDGVNYVSSKGIMNGVGENRFDPTGTFTYQQAYISVYRMLKSMEGQEPDVGAAKPEAGDAKTMSTPFSAAGHTFTILSAGKDEALRGDAKTPASGQMYFYVTFVESNPDSLSYNDLMTVCSQAYLLAPDGKQYYSSYEEPWGIYVNRVVGFSIPVNTDISSLVFVIAGQSRSLK